MNAKRSVHTATEVEDRALVRDYLARRCEAAFRALYRRHTPALWRTALRCTGDAAVADEIVQETWVRAARALAGFGFRSTLATWLHGIAANVRREHYRARVPETDVEGARLTLVPRAPVEDRVDLERAIAALAPGYREVLVLHDVEGHTHEEIAAILGVEPGTSKSQLSRARRALRAAFETPRRDAR